jgi:hypothetical protein
VARAGSGGGGCGCKDGVGLVVMLALSLVLVRCVHLTVIAQHTSTPPIDYRRLLVPGYEMAIV